jgi:hypothetical protein
MQTDEGVPDGVRGGRGKVDPREMFLDIVKEPDGPVEYADWTIPSGSPTPCSRLAHR